MRNAGVAQAANLSCAILSEKVRRQSKNGKLRKRSATSSENRPAPHQLTGNHAAVAGLFVPTQCLDPGA